MQFSRGCPFQCEFCDIINLYGRKPRTKTPEQMLAEFEVLYQLGWHRYVFVVDDNFIGNKRNAKLFLRALIPWMEARNYPFILITEASLNFTEDDELIELMSKAGFTIVFMGIETPDTDSLVRIHKLQNTRRSLVESCQKITRAGLQRRDYKGIHRRFLADLRADALPEAHYDDIGDRRTLFQLPLCSEGTTASPVRGSETDTRGRN